MLLGSGLDEGPQGKGLLRRLAALSGAHLHARLLLSVPQLPCPSTDSCLTRRAWPMAVQVPGWSTASIPP